MQHWSAVLAALGAPPDLVGWAREQPDPRGAWDGCDRVAWLMWGLARAGADRAALGRWSVDRARSYAVGGSTAERQFAARLREARWPLPSPPLEGCRPALQVAWDLVDGAAAEPPTTVQLLVVLSSPGGPWARIPDPTPAERAVLAGVGARLAGAADPDGLSVRLAALLG